MYLSMKILEPERIREKVSRYTLGGLHGKEILKGENFFSAKSVLFALSILAPFLGCKPIIFSANTVV
jgi:hypothetical protein